MISPDNMERLKSTALVLTDNKTEEEIYSWLVDIWELAFAEGRVDGIKQCREVSSGTPLIPYLDKVMKT